MRLRTGLIHAATALAAISLQAAPLPSERIGAGAKWVAHIDMDRLRNTQVGQYVLDQILKNGSTPNLAALQAVLGTASRETLSSVTLYGTDVRPENTVTLIKGTFERGRIEALAQAAEGHLEAPYGAHMLHSWIDRGHGGVRMFGCLTPDGTVVVAGETSIKRALDVLDGKTPAAAPESWKAMAAGLAAPFLVISADMQGLTNANPRAAMLTQASTAYLAVAETGDRVEGRIGVGAATDEAATQIESATRGLVAMGVLGQAQRPALARLAGATTVSRKGSQVEVQMAYPVADLIDGLKTMAEHAAQGGSPQGTRAAPPAAL